MSEAVKDPKNALIALLQKAYSGELAAAHAYAGHRDSVRDPKEKAEIEAIRLQELDHRKRVGAMLAELGGAPSPMRERVFALIGRAISLLCHLGGWFVPMYGAGKLERSNIVEYEHAARYARDAGVGHFVEDLLEMAEIEWDHELYFRTKSMKSFLWKLTPGWPPPPPREAIRATFPRQLKATDSPA